MDMSEVKAFNSELSGLYENKPPISKAKMSAITKGAIKAIKFYKHVVHSVEKFIQKCKPEYKVPGLYVIDSIVRQSRHQFGQDKDVFAPRFAKNMQQTFANLFRCPPEDKRNIIRVLNLWQKNHVFTPDVIQPLLDMADPNHPLHQEIQAQQNAANGSALNISHTDVKNSPMAQQHSPHMASPPGEQFQDQPSSGNNVKFNRKLLNDFEYDSEDDTHSEPAPPPLQPQNNTDALGSILTNPEIMRQLQSLQAQMQMMTGMQISNLMPMMPDMHLSQQQNQNAPFLNPQIPDPPKLDNREQKDEVANESDIEFVDSGPQVIEIPDANDSRSPSPSRSRRHRSRSPKSRARRRSRTRSRSRGKDRRRDRDKSYKEREADKEKQREREKKGLPPIKKENLSVCSTTLWVGHLSKLATPEELSDLFGEVGGVASIDVVAPRGCAFVVMERRRDAAKALSKLNKHKLHSKEITVAWAPGKGVKGREWKDYWEAEWGVSYLPWRRLQELWQLSLLSLDALEDGGVVDEDTLPSWLPPRMMSKPLMDMPMIQIPGTNPPPPSIPHLPMPTGLPGAPLTAIPTPIPTAMPAAIPAAMPTAVAATTLRPAISATVTGMQGEIRTPAPLIQFPPTMPPPTGGMVPGFLGGLMGMGGIMPLHLARPPPQIPQQINQQQQQQQAQPEAVTHTDDAMDLDTEDNQNEMQTETKIEQVPTTAPTMLAPDELLAFLSKPPPNFKASEPPPPLFNKQMEEPANAGNENNNNENRRDDRDRDRRDRDRDRRDRDRERRDRDRRDRGDRRGDRGRDDRERDDRRDRDRDRDRGRDRRDRDRDRDRDKDRYSRDNNERMRDRSPRHSNNADVNNDKTLQERLWDMANGKNEKRSEDNAPRLEDKPAVDNNSQQIEEDRPRLDYPPPLLETPANTIEEVPSVPNSDSGWTQLPTPRLPQMAPTFRADLRMRGPPRPPLRGPWPEGPPFGPRFNGMPPFTRPPFDRPPFDNPMFDGPPRFERPPFNRMAMPPFNGPMPPFDGSRPPFDGPRPPFDGSRPPFDGPMPPFDPTRPPFDGPMPNFDSPRLYDGPPEYFDRNNRRFDDREQFNDRGWNGDREWDRRGNNEWEDRRRDRRPRDQEERFNGRDRRNFEDRTSRDNREQQHSKENKEEIPPQENIFNTESAEEVPKLKEDRPRRDRDRKSRWGAPEDIVEQLQQLQDAQEAEFLMAMEEASRDNHLQASETLCYQEKESTNTNLNENIQNSNESQPSIMTTSQEEENTNVTQTKDVLYAQEIQAQITNIENAYGIPESENVPERDETTDSQASSQIEAASFVHSDDTRGNIEMFDAPAVENDNSESVFVKEMTIVESNLATNDTRLSALETNDPPLETDPAVPAETDHETNDAALERDIALEGA